MLTPTRYHKSHLVLTGITKLGIVWFIVALAAAHINTIWAVYIDSFVNSPSKVGFIACFLMLIGFIADFTLIPLIEKSKKSRLHAASLFLIAVCYLLFAFTSKFHIFLIIAVFSTILASVRLMSFGIIVKDKSKRSKLSENEGFLYSFANLAWIIGPLSAGFIISRTNEKSVFLIASFFIMLALFLFKIYKIKDIHVKKRIDKNIIKNSFDFFKSSKRRLCYFLGGGVNLWWSFIYIFIPLLIIKSGLPESWVAYFLFAVPIPLILFEYKFSKLAEKKGFKRIFKIGFLTVSLIALACFFASNIYIILGLLVLASIGMAMLEPTTEAHFFDICNKEEEQRFYGPYNTTINLHQSFGYGISALVLLFLPFKYLFLIFSFLMLIMFFLSFKIKDVIEKNRKG